MKPEELKEKLTGVLCVMSTPFRQDDEIDEEGLKENTGFLIDKCLNRDFVLVPTGSTGEFFALTDEERKKVIKIVIEEANGKLPVIAGTAQAATKKTLEMSKYAEDVGADGVMIVIPYYLTPTEEGMYQHFKTVAERINIGVTIYNNPAVSGAWINPSLMARLAEIKNVIGVKENTPDVRQYYAVKRAVGDRIPVLCGLGELMFSFEAALGCPGFISGFANFEPEIPLELYDAAKKADFVRVREIIERLEPYHAFRAKVVSSRSTTSVLGPYYAKNYTYMNIYKEAMNLVGLHGGTCRPPIKTVITESERNEFKKILIDLGLPVK
ncbi:MAG: hypothetical protein GTN80_02030 [Nitrososphaeria archaeon]|nr:hypothetical protein [Nitrososphaeria archaeon]NIN51869.1 hypothetical protein [Nitrososphaeria archaeon]NIQ32417.1 hypothetical protein [Nitrososphaeria archaeon]